MLDDNIEIDGVEYQICGEIGEGGVGHVYVIKDKDKHKYALKVIK
jgi:serine/threonine protein kinase